MSDERTENKGERERALKGGEEENMKFTLHGGRDGGDLRAELPERRG